jgi:hypothetical protein
MYNVNIAKTEKIINLLNICNENHYTDCDKNRLQKPCIINLLQSIKQIYKQIIISQIMKVL